MPQNLDRGTSSEAKVEASGLTPKQHRFALEYLKDCNGKQAAIRAGYAEKSAETQASRLLRNAKVRAFVEGKTSKIAAKLEITAERVLTELARLAFVDPGEFYDEAGRLKSVRDMPEDARRALHGLESFEEFAGVVPGERVAVGEVRKVRWHNKREALELLGKHLKLFSDKVDHEHSGTVEVLIRDLAKERREREAGQRA